ncbi:hypothetical protein Tco_0057474, partial [Tanacetum coccineum]
MHLTPSETLTPVVTPKGISELTSCISSAPEMHLTLGGLATSSTFQVHDDFPADSFISSPPTTTTHLPKTNPKSSLQKK